jgi:hypothetical protein
LIRQDDDGGDFGADINDGKAMRWKARIGDMEIGHLNGYLIVAEAHYPYLVYVTNSKHWSPAVRDPD